MFFDLDCFCLLKLKLKFFRIIYYVNGVINVFDVFSYSLVNWGYLIKVFIY